MKRDIATSCKHRLWQTCLFAPGYRYRRVIKYSLVEHIESCVRKSWTIGAMTVGFNYICDGAVLIGNDLGGALQRLSLLREEYPIWKCEAALHVLGVVNIVAIHCEETVMQYVLC